jgi:hypothetical protein
LPATFAFCLRAAFASRDCSSPINVCSPLTLGHEVNSLDQRPGDPRLLGWEELSQSGAKYDLDGLALRPLKLVPHAAKVRAMISGVRSRCCTWATTASSISAAGTLHTEHSA